MRNPRNDTVEPKTGVPAQAGTQLDREESGLPPSREHSPHSPERTCILTREHGTRDDLIRLALGPDGQVAPDVRARAPGRGAWIGVDREQLEAAQSKGKLKAALARAFKTGTVTVPDDLGARIETALRQTVLDRLGLEARSGALISGSEKIETAARRGDVALLLHASDAADDGRRRLDQAWRAGDGPEQGLVIPAERAILGLALGRQNVVHVALTDRAAAARVRHALDRWRAFIGPNAGLSAATATAPGASAMDVNEGI